MSICGVDGWTIDGAWHRCIFDPAVGVTGEPLFALIVSASVLMGLYWAGGGDPLTPGVVTVIFAGVMIPILPGGMVAVAYAVAVIGGVGALMGIARRYYLSPGTLQ